MGYADLVRRVGDDGRTAQQDRRHCVVLQYVEKWHRFRGNGLGMGRYIARPPVCVLTLFLCKYNSTLVQ